MRKKWSFLFLLSLLLLTCSACQVRNVTKGMEEGEHYDAVISIKTSKDSEDLNEEVNTEENAWKENGITETDIASLQELGRLLGMKDEEAAGQLGGGVENRTEDGSYLIGRNYQITLFSEKCAVYTTYTPQETVELVFVQLSGEDIVSYGEKLAAIFGKSEEDAAAEDGTYYRRWPRDGYSVILYEADGSIMLDFESDSFGWYEE